MSVIAKSYENGYNSQIIIANAGQKIFNITNGGSYQKGKGLMDVFVKGVSVGFIETHSQRIELTVPALDGDIVELLWYEGRMHPLVPTLTKPEDIGAAGNMDFNNFKDSMN